MADLDFSAINPGCFGKTAYVSKNEALGKITRMGRGMRARTGVKALTAYQCPDCRQWHIRARRLK